MADRRQDEYTALMGRISSHLPAEKLEQLKGIFAESPEAALLLGEETLAKSDYTRSIQQVRQQELALAAERQQVAQLGNKVNEYDEYLRATAVSREDYERLSNERNQFQFQLDHLKANYPELGDQLSLVGTTSNVGANMNTNNNGGVPASTARPENPIRSVSELDYRQTTNNLTALAALSPATQMDLAVKHQSIFGQPMANMTELVTESMQTGRTLEDVWMEKHNVASKIQELETQRFNQTVETKVNEELAKRIGVNVVSGNAGVNNNGLLSPFLKGMDVPVEQRQGPNGAPDPGRMANQGTGQGTAAQNATAAYLSGKYRDTKFDILST